MGPSRQIGDSDGNCYHLSLTEDRCDSILQQFIEKDTFGTKPNVVKPVSPDEKRAWIIFNETMKHNGKRYESGLLWKLDDPKPPNNFLAAQQRFFNLERKFMKVENLAASSPTVTSLTNMPANCHRMKSMTDHLDVHGTIPFDRFLTHTNWVNVELSLIYQSSTT